MRLIQSNILSDTVGIIPLEFGRTLIVSTTKNINYQSVTKASEISGAESGDAIYKKVEAFFSGETRVDSVDVVGKDTLTDASTVKTFLDEVIKKNDNFLFIFLDSYKKETVTGLVEWGIANNKFPAYTTPTTTDIDEVVNLAKSFNSRAIAFDGDDNLESRVIGFLTTTKPGYLPWSWRRLQGVQKNARLEADQRKLKEANINFINEERRGVLVLIPGKTCFGEFIKNEWGKANMEDDMHIAMVNLLTSNDPLGHPGADLSSASRIDNAIFEVIADYAGSDRKFIANWTEKEVQEGKTTQKAGTPKGWVKTKTNYTENDIKTGEFTVEWAAMPRGECLEGVIQGLLTFNAKTIAGGEQ